MMAKKGTDEETGKINYHVCIGKLEGAKSKVMELHDLI